MNVSDSLLALVLQYTQVVVPFSMFLGGIGIPLPNSMIVIVVGTLIQQNFLSIYSLSWMVILPTVCGDVLSFIMAGRILRSKKWLELTTYLRLNANISERQRAQKFFQRFGQWSILLSRFAITPLAVPINILAASTSFPLRKFILIDIAGEILWASLYTTIGYYFGIYWQEIYQLLNNFVGLISMVVIIGMLLKFQKFRKKKSVLKAQQVVREGI